MSQLASIADRRQATGRRLAREGFVAASYLAECLNAGVRCLLTGVQLLLLWGVTALEWMHFQFRDRHSTEAWREKKPLQFPLWRSK